MASHHEVVILTKGLLPSARSRSLWCMQVSQKLPTHGATGSVGMKWFWLSSAVETPEEDRLFEAKFLWWDVKTVKIAFLWAWAFRWFQMHYPHYPIPKWEFSSTWFWMNCNNLTVMSLEWWFMSEIIFKRLYFRSGNYHNLPSQWLARLWKLTSGWSQQAAFPKRNMCYSFSPLTLWVFTLAILYELDFGQSIWDCHPKHGYICDSSSDMS